MERQEVGARLLGWALPFLAMLKTSSAGPPADSLFLLQLNLEIRHDMLEGKILVEKEFLFFFASHKLAFNI